MIKNYIINIFNFLNFQIINNKFYGINRKYLNKGIIYNY